MEDLTIRLAERRDFPAVRSLYREFHDFHVKGAPTHLRTPEAVDDAEVDDALQRILDNRDAVLYVACLAERVSGLAEADIAHVAGNAYVVPRRYALLQSLAVAEGHRRRGIGQRLLEAVHAWARDAGVGDIEVETWEFPGDPGPFYAANGYRTVKRRLSASVT